MKTPKRTYKTTKEQAERFDYKKFAKPSRVRQESEISDLSETKLYKAVI